MSQEHNRTELHFQPVKAAEFYHSSEKEGGL